MRNICKWFMMACLLSGCMAALARSELTIDQLKALREYSGDVYACGVMGGPPPMGNVIFVVVPKGSVVELNFPPSCPIIVTKRER